MATVVEAKTTFGVAKHLALAGDFDTSGCAIASALHFALVAGGVGAAALFAAGIVEAAALAALEAAPPAALAANAGALAAFCFLICGCHRLHGARSQSCETLEKTRGRKRSAESHDP